MKLLIFGATGMAGHMIALYLSEQKHLVTTYTRQPFSLCNNVIGNVFDKEEIKRILNIGDFDAVINCIGILNNDAENNKYDAVYLNSLFPHFLSKELMNTKTKLIHISTDCVFSGKAGKYTEKSPTDGMTFYDRSKALGEISDEKNLTFRTSIIGPDMNENGIGLFNWFMKQQGMVNGYNKAVWSGVTTLVLAKAIECAIQQNITGLYHLVNNTTITKYELLKLFSKHICANNIRVEIKDDFVIDKSLVNTRNDFDFIVPSYEIMVMEMKEWIKRHQDIYPNYNIKGND